MVTRKRVAARAVTRTMHSKPRPPGSPGRIAGSLPPSIIKRIEELEVSLASLRRELHAEKVGFIADLRIAIGTLPSVERDKAIQQMGDATRFSDDALSMYRKDLLKFLQKLAANTPLPEKADPAREGPRYVS